MNAVVVDDKRRVRLKMLEPGDYYVPEPLGGDNILLHKVPAPRRQMSEAEVLTALAESPLRFKTSWDRLKEEIR
jgi:hypothetical protein